MIRKIGILIITTILLASCVTIPEGKKAANWLGILAHPYDLVGSVLVKNNRELLTDTLSALPVWQDGYGEIINNTQLLYAGINSSEFQGFTFDVVLLGSYPAGIISAALSADSYWEKTGEADDYWWINRELGIEIGLPESYCILLSSSGNMKKMMENFQTGGFFVTQEEIQAGFDEGDIFLYSPNPGKEILPLLSRSKRDTIDYPVRDSWIGFYAFDERYIIDGYLTLESDKAARASVVALRMLFYNWMKEEQELMDQKKNVIIKSIDTRIHMGNIFISREFAGKIISGLLK